MRGPGWRPWRAVAAAAAVTLCAGLLQATLPRPAAPPPALGQRADPAVACQDVRAGQLVACLHGNDTPPPGVSLYERPTIQELESRTSLDSPDARLRGLAQLEQATDPPGAPAAAVPCIGNGTSGNRIQAVYARALDMPDRYDSLLPSLRQWAAEADQAVWASAGPTGGARRLRFVTDPTSGGGCELNVAHVTLTSLGDNDFNQMRTELQLQGYDRSDRKYLVWVDAAVGICGLGEVYYDQRPGQENYNNDGPQYARVDTPCWQYAELHEVFHTLGAVQPDSPHPSAYLHCTDEADVMCYDDDGGGPVVMSSICPLDQEALLDCGDDDYFSTDPPNGSYLDDNWNTADSSFLQDADAPQIAQVTLSGAATITYGGRVGLSGRLSDEQTGDGLGGEPVNLYGRRAGTTSDLAAGSDTSDGGGNVGFTRTPSVTTAYRASFPGSDTYGPAGSARVTIGVRTKVTAKRSAATVRFGKTVTVTGSVGPNHRGQRVYLQRLVGGSWKTAATAVLSSASGYRLTAKPPVKGRLSYRVLKSADRDHLSGTSPRFTVTVG
jgi:hypothetical protein